VTDGAIAERRSSRGAGQGQAAAGWAARIGFLVPRTTT
jgi:hypothetical protein